MRKPILLFSAFLFLFQLAFGQSESAGFEQEYIKKNLIRKVKTTYDYYETTRKKKARKKDKREGKVIYSYNDDGRIVVAEYFLADGSFSNKDEYTYDGGGTITSVKKSRVVGNYSITRMERVYFYELHYKNGDELDYCDLTIYEMQDGKKGQGQKKKLQDINVYYPSCFEETKLGNYKKDKDGLIKSIMVDKEHERIFDYEFF